MPQNQSNIPGVYKPRMEITAKGNIPLEQEPYVPIDTDILLKLFNLGFSREALMNFMGVEEKDNIDVEEAFSTIMSRLEKGDAPGGLVGYNFPQTYMPLKPIEGGEGKESAWRTRGEYFTSSESTVPDTFNIYGFEEAVMGDKEIGLSAAEWGLKTLTEGVETVYPDKEQHKLVKSHISKLIRRPIDMLFHEPLHSYFSHYKGKYPRSQEEYKKSTAKMTKSVLENMSEEELAELIYKALYGSGKY